MTKQRIRVGREGEELARQFLANRGLRIIGVNYKMMVGEIDILAEEGKTLVIVEVKTKTNQSYGLAKEKVDFKKQAKLRKLAGMLGQKFPERELRIDVIGIDYVSGRPVIEYLPNAVEA